MDVLVVAVHPDDETLGCGGTILRHLAEGNRVHWLLTTSAQVPEFDGAAGRGQELQVERVRAAYPFETLHWLKLPSTRLTALAEVDVIGGIRDVVRSLRPEIIYTPNRSDVHSDHRVTASAVTAVTKSFHMQALGVKRVLAMEILSETDAAPPYVETAFLPNVVVDVTSTIERKLEIFSLYESEVQPDPMPRSLSALRAQARLRGATYGLAYAEAFMLLREVA